MLFANVCSDSGATLVVLEDDDWTPTDGIMSRQETYNTVVLNRTNIGRQKLSTLSGPDTRSLSFALANCNVIFT